MGEFSLQQLSQICMSPTYTVNDIQELIVNIRTNVECNTFFHSQLLLSYRYYFVYGFIELSFDQVSRHTIILSSIPKHIH